LAAEVVKADGNVRNLAWRICNAKKVLVRKGGSSHLMDSKDNTLGKLAIPFNKGTELLINSHLRFVSAGPMRMKLFLTAILSWNRLLRMPCCPLFGEGAHI
jgi:hypothetical protein